MKSLLAAAALLAGAVVAVPQQAHAIGCISGAAVGGVAGHYAGRHGLLGAAAGCAYGHHRAVVNRRNNYGAQQQQQQQQMPNGSYPTTQQ